MCWCGPTWGDAVQRRLGCMWTSRTHASRCESLVAMAGRCPRGLLRSRLFELALAVRVQSLTLFVFLSSILFPRDKVCVFRVSLRARVCVTVWTAELKRTVSSDRIRREHMDGPDEISSTVWVSCCLARPALIPLPPSIQPPLLTSFVSPRHLPSSHRALPSSTTATTTKTSYRRLSPSTCPPTRHLIDAKLVDDRSHPTGRPPSLSFASTHPTTSPLLPPPPPLSCFSSPSSSSLKHPRPQPVACISSPNTAQLSFHLLSSLSTTPRIASCIPEIRALTPPLSVLYLPPFVESECVFVLSTFLARKFHDAAVLGPASSSLPLLQTQGPQGQSRLR